MTNGERDKVSGYLSHSHYQKKKDRKKTNSGPNTEMVFSKWSPNKRKEKVNLVKVYNPALILEVVFSSKQISVLQDSLNT